MSNMLNHYRATYRDSLEMTEFKTISTDNNYNIVVGKCQDGSLRIQSILFPKEHYNIAKATIAAHFIDKTWFK